MPSSWLYAERLDWRDLDHTILGALARLHHAAATQPVDTNVAAYALYC